MRASPRPFPRSRRAAGAALVEQVVWTLLVATLVGVAALGLWRFVAGHRAPPALPVFGTVPAFSLLERNGRTVSANDLAGSVWVADFIFTRCAGTCPILSNRLAALLRRLSARGILDVRGVSFTVDPARDDPATLRAYARRFGADEQRWLFLTGNRDVIEPLVRDGFRLSIAELPPGERETALEPITHSDRFVLIDERLRIRGYYHGTDDDAVAKLEHDIAHLTGDA